MIILTGASGFIGRNVMNQIECLPVDVDTKVTPFTLQSYIESNYENIDYIIHLGANTDTQDYDIDRQVKMNYHYTFQLWKKCLDYRIKFIYASSAATYGCGEYGYSDEDSITELLRPANPYAISKHMFDMYALQQKHRPSKWYGLKFFNVYGRYEEKKRGMASMIHQSIQQINETGSVKLFKNGEQRRDFVYVGDVVNVIKHLINTEPANGIYNVGTGAAQSFNEVVGAVFEHMNKPKKIEYIEMPEELIGKYQYFTEAKIDKLLETGYNNPFLTVKQALGKII